MCKLSKTILLTILGLFLMPTTKSFGQSQPVFKRITQSGGLSNGRVTSIISGPEGFIWIGTKNGLNRYDGLQMRIYNQQNSTICSNDISDVLLDSKNRIWVSTLGGGLNLYNPLADSFTSFRHASDERGALSSNQVNTIFEDHRGRIWLGTQNGLNLYQEQDSTFRSFTHSLSNQNTLSHNSVSSIFEDASDNLWVGTFGGGLNRLVDQSGIFEHFVSPTRYFTDFIHDITGLDGNTLLIGTSGGGLVTFDTRSGTFSDEINQLLTVDKQVKIVRSLIIDSATDIWVGTDGNGLFKIDRSPGNDFQVSHYLYNSQMQSSLSGNAVYEIFEDESGNIWIGTAWNGINVLDSEDNFEFFFSDIRGSNPSPVLSVYKNATSLFLGLDGAGLTVYKGESEELDYYAENQGSGGIGNYIQFIAEKSPGVFWLGSFANGLIYFNDGTGNFKQYRHIPDDPKSLSYNDVRYLLKAKGDDLWIATWGGGLNYFDAETETFRHYRSRENDNRSLSSDNVISLQRDGDKIWVATFGGGLDLFDPATESFAHFPFKAGDENSPSSNNIHTILKDSRGNLWVGTAGEGINLYYHQTGQFQRFKDAENIRYTTVTAIVEDNLGKIWFSTKEGLFNYDYNTGDFNSLPNLTEEFHINSVFKDSEGMLYFGGIAGVYRLNPNTITYDTPQIPVKLTNLKLSNKDLSVGKGGVLTKNIVFEDNIVLNYDMDVITFEFAALQFPFSTNCEFAIKMENFDQDWREIGKDRTATFTNLPPGNYSFQVKSRQKGATWPDKFTSIQLKILKPFWHQWWAYTIYALLAILITLLLRKYFLAWERMKTNLKLEKLAHEKDIELHNFKQQFFTNISHEIRTPVTLILGSINRLLKAGKGYIDRNDSLELMKKNGNHLLQLVNELLDFKKFETNEMKLEVSEGNWVKFSKEIFLSFTEMALQKQIQFRFQSELPRIDLWFDRKQMEKVLFNLLSNAFKFTQPGGTVRVNIVDREDEAILMVKDSGIGVAKEKVREIFAPFYQTEDSRTNKETGFGLGLSISKEIIELHQGAITVESEEGFGSTFTVRLQKGNKHFDSDLLVTDYSDEELIENYLLDETHHLASPEESVDTFQLKDMTLLVVEDNHDIRQYLIEMLSEECQVLEASNGSEAFGIATNNIPDLIISDVMMPVMDGISLTRKLKSDVRTSHIPVILLTARASMMHKITGYEIGADDYITKPFNEPLLQIRIKNLLRNRQVLLEKFSSQGLVAIDELTANKTDKEFLHRLVKIVEENLDSDELNARFLSKEMGMSHSVIYKKTKAITGMTFVEFVRDLKLISAKRLLTDNQFTVAEAANQVGYADVKYFSRLFKQKFGKSPSEYLQRKKVL